MASKFFLFSIGGVFAGFMLSGCGGGSNEAQVLLPSDLNLSFFLENGTREDGVAQAAIMFTVSGFNSPTSFQCTVEHNSWYSPDWAANPSNKASGLYTISGFDQSTGQCALFTVTWADPWNASMTKPAIVNLTDITIPVKNGTSMTTVGQWDGRFVAAGVGAAGNGTIGIQGTGGKLSRN